MSKKRLNQIIYLCTESGKSIADLFTEYYGDIYNSVSFNEE